MTRRSASTIAAIVATVALLVGCAGQETSPTREQRQKNFTDLCVADTADLSLCSKGVEQAFAKAPEDCPKERSPYEADVLKSYRTQCEAMLDRSVSVDFCASFAEARYREIVRASPFCLTKETDAGVNLFMYPRACLMLADRLPGAAPETGICIYGMGRDVLPAFQTDIAAIEGEGPAEAMKKRFPPGTPIDSMLKTLTSGGFTCATSGQSGTCTSNQLLIRVTKRIAGGAGALNWDLQWHADQNGRLDHLDVHTVAVAL